MSDAQPPGGDPPGGQLSDGPGDAVPPGWHPDPWGQHTLRWWDGRQWTDQVHDESQAVQGAGDAVSSALASDTGIAQATHLLSIFTSFVGPLIIWLVKGKESAFVEQHAKEALNFQISLAFYYMVASVLIIVLIGIVLLPVLFVLDLVLCIMQTMKAGRGEPARYPFSIRLIT